MGGHTFWTTVAETGGYRLQQNQLTHHARILDAEDTRIAWGTINGMQKALQRLVDASEQYACHKNIADLEPALQSLKRMLDQGVLTQEEFQAQKAQILAQLK